MDDAVALWDDVLRSYAASLDDQRAFLLTAQPDELHDERVLTPTAFAPPATMPPMPDQFVSWAQSLVRDTEGLTQLAAALLEQMPAPMPRVRRPMPSTGEVTTGRPMWDRTM